MTATSSYSKASVRNGKKRWSKNLKTLTRVVVTPYVLGVLTVSAPHVSA